MGDGSGNKENKMAPSVNSGSRRELAPPPVQTNKVGCMSTLFHRLFHYPSNTRKRITNTSSTESRNQPDATTTTNCDSPPKHKTKLNMSRPSSLPKKKQLASAVTLGGQPRIIRLPGNIIDVQSSELTTKSHRRKMMMNSASLRPPECRHLNSLSSDQGEQCHCHIQSHSPVVAKLMGLNYDITPTPLSIKMKLEIETAADQKRRKLMGALEKCDKDLQDLKKIIEAMKKPAEMRCNSSNAVSVETDNCYYGRRRLSRSKLTQLTHDSSEDDDQREAATTRGGVKNLPGGQQPELISSFDMSMEDEMKQFDRSDCDQQPSPVSVLDASSHRLFISSPSSPALKLGAGEDKHIRVQKVMNSSLLDTSRVQKAVSYMVKPPSNSRLAMMWSHPGWRRGLPRSMMEMGDWRRRWRVSEAMRETVNEVWIEGVRRHGWQVGRVGAVVETHIFGDLLADMLMDLLLITYQSSSGCPSTVANKNHNISPIIKPYSTHYKLPFEVCRKRLSF